MANGLRSDSESFSRDNGFEEIEHTADCSLRIYGSDLHELMLNAARGMTRLMVLDGEAIGADVERRFDLEAMDAESLLVEWLSELVFLAEAEMLVFSRFELRQVTSNPLAGCGLGQLCA